MLPPDRELEFLKFLDRLSTHLKQMRDPRKALRHSLRDAREFLNATHGVRDRIDRKIMEQLHPKDLFYQILDGLRSLTRYDHSSALLIRESGDDALQLVAE